MSDEGMMDKLMISAKDALSPTNLLKRLFYTIFFAGVLGIRTIVSELDLAGQAGRLLPWGWASAIAKGMWSGVFQALGSVWSVVSQPNAYFSSNSWGSIIFTVVAMLFLVMFFFQPVSLFVNLFDLKSGQATGGFMRFGITIIVVLALSAVVFYTGGGEMITSSLNTTIVNDAVNVSENITVTGDVLTDQAVATIDFIGGG